MIIIINENMSTHQTRLLLSYYLSIKTKRNNHMIVITTNKLYTLSLTTIAAAAGAAG